MKWLSHDLAKHTSLIIPEPSRRTILKGLTASGGLLLMAGCTPKAPEKPKPARAEEAFDVGVYLAIEPDGTVAVTCHRVEMGQGSTTGLPMIIMEELDADWSRFKFIQGEGNKAYGDQNTDGSTSIRKFYDAFREAGASARAMLEQAAANHWGIDVSLVSTKGHAVHHGDNSLDFADLVGPASKLPVPETASLTFKSRDEWKYVGTGMSIINMQDMITGNTEFGQDVRVEGMVYSVIARPAVVGGKVVSFDDAAARAVNGVLEVVQLPDFKMPAQFFPLGGVAVIATNTWAAIKGREALEIEWDHGANVSLNSDSYDAMLRENAKNASTVAVSRGDIDAGFEASASEHEAEYFVAAQNHAMMEPPAATADWSKKTIWTCCQDPQTVQATVGTYLGEPAESHAEIWAQPTLLGGAFGRKSKPDFAAEAAWLSKSLSKPVKVIWTREDEMQHGFYHANSAQYLKAGADESGDIIAWKQGIAYPSIMGTFNGQQSGPFGFELDLGIKDFAMKVPNVSIAVGEAPWQVRIGWLRSVTNIQQAFAIHSFVDEMAHKAERDPVDYIMAQIGEDRLINPSDDGIEYGNYGETLDRHPIDTGRMKAVLKKAADMAGWGRELPEGRGLGIAMHRSFVSSVATVVEVSVINGVVKVEEAWTAIDCGLAVNTDRVKSQMEGSIVFGLQIFKHGAITFKDGAVEQSNYDNYILPRIDEVGTVHAEIMANDHPPGGVGEPAVPPAVPAIANAVFAATGKRIRTLPLADQLA